VPLLSEAHRALAKPEHCASSSLYGLKGNRWQPVGTEQVALRENIVEQGGREGFFVIPLEANDWPPALGQLSPIKGSSLGRFIKSALEALKDNAPKGDGGKPNDETAEGQMLARYREHMKTDARWSAVLPEDLSAEKADHWIGAELSARLGLPLIRLSFRFYTLGEEEPEALSLPFFTPLPYPVPVAVLLRQLDIWAHLYDDGGNLVRRRSFPDLPPWGHPLLRKVMPVSSRDSAEGLANACEWFRLSPEILNRLSEGYPQVVLCALVHSLGWELNLTLLQRQLPYRERALTSAERERRVAEALLKTDVYYNPSDEARAIIQLDVVRLRRLEVAYIVDIGGGFLRTVDEPEAGKEAPVDSGSTYVEILSKMESILEVALADVYLDYADGHDIPKDEFRRQWTEKKGESDEQQSEPIRDLRGIRALLNLSLGCPDDKPQFFDWVDRAEERLAHWIDKDEIFRTWITERVLKWGSVDGS
jgi:hypothetical protein